MLADLINAGKSLDQSSSGFLIESLGVAELTFLQRGVDEHLDEGQRRLRVLMNASRG